MLTYGPEGLSYTRFFWTESRQLLSVFPLQPAWSLSVELCFYALAPVLVRSPVKIIAVVLAAFTLRWCAFRYNFGADPYSYRFFPIEIGTFMLGALSYYLYRATVRWPQRLAPVAGGLVCGLVIMFGFLPQTKLIAVMFEDRELLFYGAMVLLLPFAFRFTAKHSWDRLAGEISFPLYLSHWVVVLVLGSMMDRTALFGIAALLLSLFCAALTYWLVDRPLDRYRHRLSLGQQAMQPA